MGNIQLIQFNSFNLVVRRNNFYWAIEARSCMAIFTNFHFSLNRMDILTLN